MQQSDATVSRAALRDAIRWDLEVELKAREVIADPGFDGAPVLTIPALTEALDAVFAVPLPPPDERHAEVRTPASIVVHAICPRCDRSARSIVELSATLVVDSPSHAEIRVAAKSKARTHVCGQEELPEGPEVAEGQTTIEALLDADDAAGETPSEDQVSAEPTCTKTPGCTRAVGHRGFCRDADGKKLAPEDDTVVDEGDEAP